MTKHHILLILVISLILIIGYCIFSNYNNYNAFSPNYQQEEGVYDYDFKTAPSEFYPGGKHETGTRTITNENYGQISVSNGIVSYMNNNGQLITKDDNCEHIYIRDLQGKKIMLLHGNLRNVGLFNFVSEKDGSFIYESVFRKSDLMHHPIKQISKYYKTKDGYRLEITRYNENMKQFVPYRWGLVKKKKIVD
jgi:hypothetical protein